MHKCLKVGAFAVAGFLALGAVGLVVGSLAIDSALEQALAKVSAKVSGLKLSNRFTSTSPLSREGVLMWSYAPRHKILGHDYLEGGLKYTLSLGLFKVLCEFSRQEGFGNVDSLFTELGFKPLNYNGSFEASLLKMSLQGQLNTDALDLPVADGSCSLGQQHVTVSTTTFRSFKTALTSEGISCTSPLLYRGKPAYDLKLSGLKIKANPTLVNHKPQLDEVQMSIEDLEGSASSLYLIGFTPEDPVRDPSMREGFKFSKLNFKLQLGEQDRLHRYSLNFAGSGDLLFGFPLQKENQTQPWFDLTDTKLNFALQRIDLLSLPKLASADKASLPKLVTAIISDPLSLKLERFSFMHQGEQLLSKGEGRFSLDPAELRPRNLFLDFNFSLGQKLVDSLFEQQYKDALQDALKSGAVRFDGKNYQTRFVLKDNNMSLNGLPISSAQ